MDAAELRATQAPIKDRYKIRSEGRDDHAEGQGLDRQ